MEHVIVCKCVPVVSKIPKFLRPLPGARRRGFLAPGGRAAHALDGSISNRTDAGGFPQRRCPQAPCRRLNFASSCGWRPVVQQFIQFRSYSDGLSPHLFCRQNTCAPIGVVACGSSGPPTSRTRSKDHKERSKDHKERSKDHKERSKTRKGSPKTCASPAKDAADVLQRRRSHWPHRLAAYSHRAATACHAGANNRAKGLGVSGGVLLPKTRNSLYIRFFFFYFSFPIGLLKNHRYNPPF